LKTVLGTIGNDAAARVKALNERRDARITRAEPNLLTPEEMRRFLEVAKVRWPQHYALILLLFTTAMRIGTALALRWEDLDLDTMEIIVTRRLSGYGPRAEVVPGVKRDRFGEDAPPLLAEVLEELRTLRSGFNDAQLASGLLFPTRDGKHHYRTLLQKPFKDICEHAGITKRFTPHGCRRTGAKLYGRAAGTRMAMSIAGHMTEAMHEHYTPVDAQEKLAAASQVFGYLRAVEGAAAEDRTALEVETGTSTGTPGGEGAKTA
jgi:integrase